MHCMVLFLSLLVCHMLQMLTEHMSCVCGHAHLCQLNDPQIIVVIIGPALILTSEVSVNSSIVSQGEEHGYSPNLTDTIRQCGSYVLRHVQACSSFISTYWLHKCTIAVIQGLIADPWQLASHLMVCVGEALPLERTLKLDRLQSSIFSLSSIVPFNFIQPERALLSLFSTPASVPEEPMTARLLMCGYSSPEPAPFEKGQHRLRQTCPAHIRIGRAAGENK